MAETQPAGPLPYPQRHLSGQHTSSNPRRCSPDQSVSLPPHKRQKLHHDEYHSGPRGPQDTTQSELFRDSSQGSSSDLSGLKWFDSVNEKVTPNIPLQKGYEAEPPFFMSTRDHYKLPAQTSTDSDEPFGAQVQRDSEKEELRDVIDDLTVENKTLKQMLRSQKGRSSSHVDVRDALFEVKLHGLPAGKKRELEVLLEHFASSLHMSRSTKFGSCAARTKGNPSPDSLQSKTHVLTDSGYGSSSGMTSAATSNGGRSVLPMSETSKQNSIDNYLHNIPDVLLPRSPVVMNERARMAVVVRKLEQLFTGKDAKPGLHRRPVHQQETSETAAHADQQVSMPQDELPRAERTREAHIHLQEVESNFETGGSPPCRKSHTKDSSSESSLSQQDSRVTSRRDHSPEQCLTTPLDLDNNRSVVPGENLNYVRHLGLSTSQFDEAHVESGDWIYLNLLVNMAQLHTMNVTPDFVRRSIRKLSTRLEISEDGHQIRWNGGSGGTRFSANEEKLLECEPADRSATNKEAATRYCGSSSITREKSACKPLTSQADGRLVGVQTSSVSQTLRSSSASFNQLLSVRPQYTVAAFDHKPLVFGHKASASRRDNMDLESHSSTSDPSASQRRPQTHRENVSKLTQPRAEEGTMTFYNTTCFFSDLSLETMPVNHKEAPVEQSCFVLGVPCSQDEVESPLRYHDACYFTAQFAERESHEDNSEAMTFSPTTMSAAGEDEVEFKELPASGIGGTTPEDNFVVDVKIERVSKMASGGYEQASGRRMRSHYAYHVCRTNRFDLRPAPLPSPSYLVFSADSSSVLSESVDESESESSDLDESQLLWGQPFLFPSSSFQEQGVDFAPSDGSQDPGIDQDAGGCLG